MADVGLKENKLMQTLYNNDWIEVSRICECEPELINTLDKHGFTPLIYAVQERSAPDEVVRLMIDKADTELIENEDEAGYTILHLLAVNSYSLSLRRTLERSRKHINKRDDDGRTPLHDCMDTACSYEQHREIAICLVTYGAAVTIKDDWGKTPLDLYDDNECEKYEESTKKEKKEELKEFLQGKIPLEVLARGPEANNAFIEAIEEGSKRIYQTRLMIVGPERVGKTSLSKALTGQVFDATEVSTDGIETSLLCTLSVKHTTNWKPNKYQGGVGEARGQYIRAVAEKIAAKLKETQKEPRVSEESIEDKIKDIRIDEIEIDIGKTPEMLNILQSTQESLVKRPGHPESPTPCKQKVPEEVIDLVLQILKEKEDGIEESPDENLTLSIWDFAGQDLYYITHQVFLVSRAIYIICFNLCHDLNALATIEVYYKGHGKIFSEQHKNMTNLDFIVFWLRSIYSNTTENSQSFSHKQLSPSVFIVGTHRESIPGSCQEKLEIAEMKFGVIQQALKGTPYEGHVVSRYYAIDNSLGSPLDQSIVELREHITEVAKLEKYMGQEIPIKWLNFLQEIEELGQTRQSINFKEMKDIAANCGVVKNIQLFTMLHFYHDLGNIIYYGELSTPESALNDIIILKPNWLICIFRRVFTVKDRKEQWGKFKRSWDRLDREGLLEEKLIEHMWHEFLVQLEGLLQMMQKFDLLCEKTNEVQKLTLESVGNRLFYAPSLLKKQSDDVVSIDQLKSDFNSSKSVMLYIDFKGFLPEGLFYRLIVRLLQWSQRKGGYEPRLFYQQANMYLDENHDMIIRIMPENTSVIQVAIVRPSLVGSDDEEEEDDDVEPSTTICITVLNLLDDNINYLGHTWMKRIDFTFSVLCKICIKKNITHFHELERCLREKAVPCGIHRMRTTKVQRFFGQYKNSQETVKTAANLKTRANTSGFKKIPPFLRSLSGVFKEISSPIMSFDLMTEICVLLDPLHPSSNDWRGVACKLGYDHYIHYLARKDSPTMCVMNGWSEKGLTLEDFKKCMYTMNRHDVVRLIDESHQH